MRSYKWLLFGGSIMFLAALISLFLDAPLHLSAGSEVCGTSCSITETTVADFVPGTFNYTGIRNQGDGEVQLLPVGLTSPWYTDTYRLPVAVAELAAAIYRDPNYRETIYAIGGIDNSQLPRSEIYTATTTITGAIAAPGWVHVGNLDAPLFSTQAVISTTAGGGGFLYVIGGYTLDTENNRVVTSTIFYKTLNSNGTIPPGSWNRAALPDLFTPTGGDPFYWHQAFVHNGYLYVAEGVDESWSNQDPIADVNRAQIQSNGSLGSWIADTPALRTRGSFASAIWNSENNGDWLYLIGGIESQSGMGGQVYLADTDYTSFVGGTSGGLTNPFQALSAALPGSRYGHTAVEAGGVLYTIGGDQSATGAAITNTVLVGLIDSTPAHIGELAFPWLTTRPLAEGRKYHASVISSIGEIYVIGGFGPDGLRKDTIYHGSTSGTGFQYPPNGNYTSRIIDRGASTRAITNFQVNTTITQSTGITLTFFYRSANSQSQLTGKGWTLLGNASTGTGVTTTFPISPAFTVTDSLIQYRVLYSTTNINYTPIMNAFQINYPAPPPPPVTPTPTATATLTGTLNLPEFWVSAMSAPAESGSAVTQTIPYSVSNSNSAFSAPVRRVVVNPQAPAGASSKFNVPPQPTPARSLLNRPLAPAAPPDYLFYISFYAFGTDTLLAPTKPMSQTNAMSCVDDYEKNPGHSPGIYPPYIYWNPLQGSELTRTPKNFWAKCWVPANTKNFYVQIDACSSTDPYCSVTYGYVQEQSEAGNPPDYTSNILGPVAAGTTLTRTVPVGPGFFLPYIRRDQ